MLIVKTSFQKENKKSPQEILLETSKSIPAVPLKLRPTAVPSGSNKPYPCNGGTRENLKTSALRLGSDGSRGCILLPFTNRQLSERALTRTVFVTAFFLLPILYHVHVKKSNVFLQKIHFLFPVQNPIASVPKNLEKLPVDKRGSLWLNDIRIYHKDIDGNPASFGCSREPAAGVSRCG